MAVKVLDGPLPGTNRGPRVVSITAVLPAVETAAGKWCEIGVYLVPRSARACASYYRRSRGDRFEFASRTVDGKGVLYARLRVEGEK